MTLLTSSRKWTITSDVWIALLAIRQIGGTENSCAAGQRRQTGAAGRLITSRTALTNRDRSGLAGNAVRRGVHRVTDLERFPVPRVTDLEKIPVRISKDEAPMPLPVVGPLFISPCLRPCQFYKENPDRPKDSKTHSHSLAPSAKMKTKEKNLLHKKHSRKRKEINKRGKCTYKSSTRMNS